MERHELLSAPSGYAGERIILGIGRSRGFFRDARHRIRSVYQKVYPKAFISIGVGNYRPAIYVIDAVCLGR